MSFRVKIPCGETRPQRTAIVISQPPSLAPCFTETTVLRLTLHWLTRASVYLEDFFSQIDLKHRIRFILMIHGCLTFVIGLQHIGILIFFFSLSASSKTWGCWVISYSLFYCAFGVSWHPLLPYDSSKKLLQYELLLQEKAEIPSSHARQHKKESFLWISTGPKG